MAKTAKTEEMPEPKMVSIFVAHKGTDARPESYTDEKGRKRNKYYLDTCVNGVKFEVICDKQTEVPEHVAEALKPLIEMQEADR